MITLLPLPKVLVAFAVTYALLVVGCLLITEAATGPQGILKSLRYAFIFATPLQALLLVGFSQGWRWLWRQIPWLNRSLFPDLNGNWAIQIDWTRGGNSGSVDAMAVIRQDFLRISMEVHSNGSDSQTLAVQPKRDPESGRPILHYLYLVTPRAIGAAPAPYFGAAILRFYEPAGTAELRGNYWTSTPSVGHFRLSRN